MSSGSLFKEKKHMAQCMESPFTHTRVRVVLLPCREENRQSCQHRNMASCGLHTHLLVHCHNVSARAVSRGSQLCKAVMLAASTQQVHTRVERHATDSYVMPVMQVMYVQPAVAGAKAVAVVENLSVSNGDHVVNGLDFLHDGRLLIAVGSQTNAGIEGALGLLPVSFSLKHAVTQNCLRISLHTTRMPRHVCGDEAFSSWAEYPTYLSAQLVFSSEL